jgi:hypothetical protein
MTARMRRWTGVEGVKRLPGSEGPRSLMLGREGVSSGGGPGAIRPGGVKPKQNPR